MTEADVGWLEADEVYALRRRTLRRVCKGRTDSESQYIAFVIGDPCVYCGQPSEVLDHIAPKRYGGDDSWTNLCGACRHCNGAKHARSLLTFLAWRMPGGWRDELAQVQGMARTWQEVGR